MLEPSDNEICPRLSELRGIWFKINLSNLCFCFDGEMVLFCCQPPGLVRHKVFQVKNFSSIEWEKPESPISKEAYLLDSRFFCSSFAISAIFQRFFHYLLASSLRLHTPVIFHQLPPDFGRCSALLKSGKFINILNRFTQPLISLVAALFCSSIATATVIGTKTKSSKQIGKKKEEELCM